MNEKINADLKSLKFIFNKNKSYIFPIVLIFISVILVFQFVIPQFNSLISAMKVGKEASLKLSALRVNLDMLTNIDDEALDSQLKILSSALPLNKDFIGMLNSIYSIAQKTGVSLGGFSIQIGDISKSESSENFPMVRLSLPINSGISAINSFVEAISKSVPLSEVSAVKLSGTASNVSLSFYYKPLGSSNFTQDSPMSPVSQKALDLVSQLSGFSNASSQLNPIAPVSTSSAF